MLGELRYSTSESQQGVEVADAEKAPQEEQQQQRLRAFVALEASTRPLVCPLQEQIVFPSWLSYRSKAEPRTAQNRAPGSSFSTLPLFPHLGVGVNAPGSRHPWQTIHSGPFHLRSVLFFERHRSAA